MSIIRKKFVLLVVLAGIFQAYGSQSSSVPSDDMEDLTSALTILKLNDQDDENLNKYEGALRELSTNEEYKKNFPVNQFSPQDYVNIFHLFFQKERVDENLLVRIFQYHLIYNSMFPSCYESEDIKNILEKNNVLSVAVEEFKDVDNTDLKNLCATIYEMYETDYLIAYYDLEENIQTFHTHWIDFARELKDLIPEKRSVLMAFISYLPDKISIVPPLQAFKEFKGWFGEIYTLDNFEKIGTAFGQLDISEDPLSSLHRIIKENQPQKNIVEGADDYEAFRAHLLMLRDDKKLTQVAIARMLGVDSSTVSKFIRGVITESPKMLANFRTKIVYPEFKYKKPID